MANQYNDNIPAVSNTIIADVADIEETLGFFKDAFEQIGTGWSNATVANFHTKFLQDGTGAVTRTAQNKNRETISVTDFGVSTSESAANNLAYFQAAVDAAPAGSRVIVPASASAYEIDTSGGLSTAIEIDKKLTLQIDGLLLASDGDIQENPNYIFNVSGDDVTFCGSGKIYGKQADVDDTNAGDETTTPGLIYVSGDRFSISGITISIPSKAGIHLVSCYESKIESCHFSGGPTSYTEGNTAHFAIRIYGGGKHIIRGNTFSPDGDGGMFVSCIFSVSSNNLIISNNVCNKPWEKLSYLYGSYNLISCNQVTGDFSNSNQITSAFRNHGSYNKISNNIVYDFQGGVVIYDGIYNEISYNQLLGIGQAGIAVGALDGGTIFSGTKIIGNTIIGDAVSTKSNGIQLIADGGDSAAIIISNNIIVSMADESTNGGIYVGADTGHALKDLVLSGNTINTAYNGIYLLRVTDSIINNNTIAGMNESGYGIVSNSSARNQVSNNFLRSPGAYAFYETSSSVTAYRNNQIRSAGTSGVSGAGANSYEIGDQYDDTMLKNDHVVNTDNGLVADNVDTAGEIATQMNAYATSINGILTALRKYGILKTS